MIDPSVMKNLHHFEQDYIASGGSVSIIGHENHTPISELKLATRKN